MHTIKQTRTIFGAVILLLIAGGLVNPAQAQLNKAARTGLAQILKGHRVHTELERSLVNSWRTAQRSLKLGVLGHTAPEGYYPERIMNWNISLMDQAAQGVEKMAADFAIAWPVIKDDVFMNEYELGSFFGWETTDWLLMKSLLGESDALILGEVGPKHSSLIAVETLVKLTREYLMGGEIVLISDRLSVWGDYRGVQRLTEDALLRLPADADAPYRSLMTKPGITVVAGSPTWRLKENRLNHTPEGRNSFVADEMRREYLNYLIEEVRARKPHATLIVYTGANIANANVENPLQFPGNAVTVQIETPYGGLETTWGGPKAMVMRNMQAAWQPNQVKGGIFRTPRRALVQSWKNTIGNDFTGYDFAVYFK